MMGHIEEEVSWPLGKKGKRVSFPPDELMVSGFAESKDALQDGASRTLEDIILAYEQSCIKHEVKPNLKIMEQIKEIVCLNMRADHLNLKGVDLDHHSCESLEEILKCIKFNLINLQEAKLEENGAASLLDMILYYESATQLDLSSSTSMGISGWQALSRLLKQSECLWRLDLCNVPMLEYPAQALSKALLTSRLTVLHLENTCLSGKPLFTLVCSLKKNTLLQELYLGDNKLNSFQDSMQLGELLKYNCTLKTLDLSNNAISDSGLEEVCDGLKVQKCRLRTLVLYNNQITHHGMKHLQQVLTLLTTLKMLDLGKNDLQDLGMHTLKESLISNRSITQLSLASTGITCEGAVVLAEFLAESRILRALNVGWNLVLTGGLMALALALKINRSLARLDLDHNPKEEEDEFLIETQKNLLSRISDLCAANAAAASRTSPASTSVSTHGDNQEEAASPRGPTQTLADGLE